MAGFTVGRETCTLVIRVVGAVVVPTMTSKTGVGGVAVVTADVAGYASVGNGSVCAYQRIEIVVVKT